VILVEVKKHGPQESDFLFIQGIGKYYRVRAPKQIQTPKLYPVLDLQDLFAVWPIRGWELPILDMMGTNIDVLLATCEMLLDKLYDLAWFTFCGNSYANFLLVSFFFRPVALQNLSREQVEEPHQVRLVSRFENRHFAVFHLNE
jgi:hypothetical protein